MSTDRELLELAAKASGFDLTGWDWMGYSFAQDWQSPDPEARKYWNPLIDDGDALRLAVKLRIDVIHDDPRDNDAWVMAGPNMDCVEDIDGEASRSAATRRAIVRAAAEIGRGMP